MSEFFRGLIRSEMTEKRTGIWKIDDFSEKTVEFLLRFVHSAPNANEVPDGIALELFSAAHRYGIPELIVRLSFFTFKSQIPEQMPKSIGETVECPVGSRNRRIGFAFRIGRLQSAHRRLYRPKRRRIGQNRKLDRLAEKEQRIYGSHVFEESNWLFQITFR